MNISGIVVVALPENVAEVAQSLSDLPGLEVYQSDVASGKLVVIHLQPQEV